MAWDDWLFGILTGGAYNLGKTAYEVSSAAGAAGGAIGEVSDSIGKLSAELAKDIGQISTEMDDFLAGLTKMLNIERPVPRTPDELWEEEARRLKDLRAQEVVLQQNLDALTQQFQQQLADLINSGDASWIDILTTSMQDQIQLAVAQSKLAIVQNAIHEILYNEPGVVPSAIYEAKEILARINTMEQPRIEDLLDSVNGSVSETTGVLAEIKKLFVIQTWQQVPLASLSVADQNTLAGLRLDLQNYNQLIAKNTALTQVVMKNLINVHPDQVQFPILAKDVKLSDQPAKAIPQVKKGNKPDGAASQASSVNSSASGKTIADVAGVQMPFLDTSWTQNLLKNRAFTVSSILQRDNVSAFLQNHSVLQGQLKLYERQRVQVEKAIHAYEWELVEEPGVIPQTLDEIKTSINLVNTQGMPRLNTILDSTNLAVVDARGTLASLTHTLDDAQQTVTKVNQSLDGVKTFFGSLLFKIAAGVLGVLVAGILIFSLVILIRLAFHI